VTTNGYNNEDGLTSIDYSDGMTPDVTYDYNSVGLKTSMVDGTGTTSYHYDGLDRLTSTTNGDGQTISYGYDDDNDITSIEYPNSETVTRTFYDDDTLHTVEDWLGNTTTFAYDPDSNLTTTTFPSGTSDVDTDSYNHADQLTGITFAQGTTTLASLSYTLDPANLITEEDQTGLPGNADTAYTYTPNEQLATAGSLNYGYDNADNLTQLDSSGSNTYSYNDDSELTSGPDDTYAYDNLGERTSDTPTGGSTTNYGYDQTSDLLAVTPPSGSSSSGATYTYDGNGELASETVGSTTSQFAWDATASVPVLLTDGSTSYIYGPNGPIEQVGSDSTVTYLHQDQIGSTRLITDSSGDVVGTFTYNPYGSLSGSTGTATSLLGYAGQYTDPATGLEYNQARRDDPTTGQFMVVDPKVETTWQAYAYAGDDPLNSSDSTGELDKKKAVAGARKAGRKGPAWGSAAVISTGVANPDDKGSAGTITGRPGGEKPVPGLVEPKTPRDGKGSGASESSTIPDYQLPGQLVTPVGSPLRSLLNLELPPWEPSAGLVHTGDGGWSPDPERYGSTAVPINIAA
jgi:RHS repeat-associated protein